MLIRKYTDVGGNDPFREWFLGLDAFVADAVDDRLRRAEEGNLGDWKPLAGLGGIRELRIHHGKGWRVYFGQDGKEIILLLGGGSKSRQDRDKLVAAARWKDYKERKRAEQRDKSQKTKKKTGKSRRK